MSDDETYQGTTISVLPFGCISEILSLTSPRDACRAAAISKPFNTAADSDGVWEQFLPPDYRQVISRADPPPVFATKKQLYLFLSESHILLDRGCLGFKLEKESGKKCYMLRARDLSIAHHNDPRYWEWGHVPESRFAEVGILIDVCWLDIHGKMEAAMLSRKTTYVANLVFRLTSDTYGLRVPAETIISFSGIRKGTSNVYLQEPRAQVQTNYVLPRMRKDGWMEIELGEFYCDDGDDGEVNMWFREITRLNWKSGLIVEGIEVRPK